MSEQSGQYKIQIKTEADTSGAQKEADALKKVGAAAKDAAAELKKVSTGVSADALGEHNVGWQAENLKEVGKGAEKAEEGFRVFGKLGQERSAILPTQIRQRKSRSNGPLAGGLQTGDRPSGDQKP